MEVKAGYKQTEVGVIPEDWDIPTIETIIDEISMGPFGSNIKVSNFISSGVPVLNGANVSSERLKDDFDNFVSPEKARSLKKAVARRGDIVVTHRGTIGQIAYIPDNSAFDHYVVSQSQFRVRFTKKFAIPAWVVLYFHSEQGSKRLLEGKGHTGVPAIAAPTKTFRNLSIPLPAIAEQEAIAEALGDADALIEALDQLIAKKRQVKQGAMQELLTGKKRLAGFSGEWEVKKLGDLCTAIMDGTHFTPKYVNDGVPFYSVENLTADNFKSTKFISLQEHNRLIKRCKPEKGDILMTRIGSLGDTKLIDWDVNASIYVSLALLKVNKKAVNGNYLYCYTKSRKFIKDVELRSLINAIPQKINMENIGQVPILVPSPEEQTAIAEILSDMDAEIAALEGKLSKAREVKQGMMSVLLTGRVRLI